MVAKKFLIEPSKEDYALENSDPTFDTSMGQAEVVRKILNNKVKAAALIPSYSKCREIYSRETDFLSNVVHLMVNRGQTL